MANYNKIFDKIMEESKDGLIGMVAYSLYKSNKKQWILDYQKENNTSPDRSARDVFELAQTSNQIEMYITEAGNMLAEFYSELLEDNLPSIKSEIETTGITSIIANGLKEIETSIKPKLSYQIGIAVLGAFTYSMVLLVLYLVIINMGFDLANVLILSNPTTN